MTSRDQRVLGLQQVAPIGSDTIDNTTIDIVAIHGLETGSPRTWEYKKGGGGAVNWISDSDMLPAALPQARIYTYDWDASCFQDAPVQTLLGHADNLLACVTGERSPASQDRPIIFVASCFGGLILAEAICRAAQEGSRYRHVLLSTVGAVFLATPFGGSEAAAQAQWLIIVKGIMGDQSSDQLVRDLEEKHDFVRQRVQKFAEIANADSVRLPVHCFFETRKTELLRKLFSHNLATWLSSPHTHKILVSDTSACLHGFPRQGLNATHSGMNKFGSPEDRNFELVRDSIYNLSQEASGVLKRRKTDAKQYEFMVPFGRNERFVGREPILHQLLERIPPSANKDICQRTVVEGLGGVGKTQIALEAASRVHNEHPDCHIFWVPALDVSSFENAYRDIGQKLNVRGIDEDKADVKALVKAALNRESAGSWLLVVDNADDVQLLFGDTGLSKYLPFSSKGSILFTTRNNEVTVGLDVPRPNTITVAEMCRAEAIEMLQGNLKESQMRDAVSTASLLDFLADLPLAIKQASAYIAKTGISTAQYLSHCQSSNKDLIRLLSKDFEDPRRYKAIRNPVATTWLISFDQVSRDNQLAIYYLKFMCFLAEKNIPQSLLPTRNELEMIEATSILKSYAFITEREEQASYDIHRLVRLVMRNWLEKEGQLEDCVTSVIRQLRDTFPSPKHENRDMWVKYLPHALAALEFRGSSTDEIAQEYVLFSVGECHTLMGKYEAAEQMYRQALQMQEEVLGKDHPHTLMSMGSLALSLRQQGKYAESESIHRQTLKMQEEVLGKDHPHTLISICYLALSLHQQGKYAESESMHRQALQLQEEVLGKDHPHTLMSMGNLALSLHQQGKYAESESMHRQTLKMQEEVLGKDHPHTLMSMCYLAVSLHEQGKYAESEAMHRQTLQLQKEVLGKDHPHTLISMGNLAVSLRQQRKYAESESIHQQTLKLQKEVLGKDHPDTLMSMGNLAISLQEQGKYAESESIIRQTLKLQKEVLGKDHPDTLMSMGNLAVSLHEQGKYAESEAMHRQTLKLQKEVLGKDHPYTLMSMGNLAVSLRQQGKYAESEAMHRQTLKLQEEVLGKDHPYTLMSMGNLAVSLRQQGKYAESEAMHRQTLKLQEEVLGKDHPYTLMSMGNLAVSLRQQGKDAEAEALAQEGSHRHAHRHGQPRIIASTAGRRVRGHALAGTTAARDGAQEGSLIHVQKHDDPRSIASPRKRVRRG